MIEEGFINEEISRTIIQNYLKSPILENIDSLILACTHYPLIQEEKKQYYNNNINVIDSANIVANYINEKLESLNLHSETTHADYHFYVSNYTSSFEKSAQFFFRENIKLEEITLPQ